MKLLKRIKSFYKVPFDQLIPIFENYVIDNVQILEGDTHIRQINGSYGAFYNRTICLNITLFKHSNFWKPDLWEKYYINWKKICKMSIEFEIIKKDDSAGVYHVCKIHGYNFMCDSYRVEKHECEVLRALLFRIEDTIHAPVPPTCHVVLDHISEQAFT